MDDIDRRLVTLITTNPRAHFHELAKMLGISRQAVHHRVQALIKTGVIRGSEARISVPYLDAVPVAVFGRSNTSSVEKTMDRLGENEFTCRVIVAGGNTIYVAGLLRSISELDGYAEFVRQVAEIADPTVGIYSLDPRLMPDYTVNGIGKRKEICRQLVPLDLRIIASLKDDARKPIAQVAKEVGASAKTVRRHLDRMVSEGSLELHLTSDAPSAGDLLFLMHVALKEGADKVEVGRRLLSKLPFQDAYVRAFSNIPNLLLWVFWTDDMKRVRATLGDVGEDKDVQSVTLNLGYLERLYPTWRDNLPVMWSHPGERARMHILHPKLRT